VKRLIDEINHLKLEGWL